MPDTVNHNTVKPTYKTDCFFNSTIDKNIGNWFYNNFADMEAACYFLMLFYMLSHSYQTTFKNNI